MMNITNYMTSQELKNKFFEFEYKYRLFEQKTLKGVFWWDIVRYSIYTILNEKLILKSDLDVDKKFDRRSIYSKVVDTAKSVLKDTFIIMSALILQKKYFFYLCSRNQNEQVKYYDAVSQNIIDTVGLKKSFLLESFNCNNNANFVYENTILKILLKVKINDKVQTNLDDIIKEHFDIEVNTCNLLEMEINRFHIERKYYFALFKLIKPNHCFVIQNGIQKAFFSAANACGIPCHEIQHGLISEEHLAYSYSDKISFSHLDTFPFSILTYAEFWHRIYYPVKRKLAIGTNYSIKKVNNNNYPKSIAVIFADIYTNNLLPFVQDLAQKYKGSIVVKLHPNQKNQYAEIKSILSNYCNIKVVYIEKTIDEIISLSSALILIQSTVAYEALQAKKKLFILKRQNYDIHSDIFHSENVYLIDSVDDFLANKDMAYFEEDLIFFESFDKRKLISFLAEF